MLIHSTLLRYVENEPLARKYDYLREVIHADRFSLLDQSVISPMKFNLMPSDVQKLITWINTKIVLNLPGFLNYPGNKTFEVLLRIATGMINKLDIPEIMKQQMHTNMIKNLRTELYVVDADLLPFQGVRV